MIRSCKNLLFHFSDRFGRAALAAVGMLAFAAIEPARAADWTDASGNEYTALKYIKGTATGSNTGGGWIVTEIQPVSNDVVKTRFKLTETRTQSLWCSRGKTTKTATFTGFYIDSIIRCDRNGSTSASGQTRPSTSGDDCAVVADYGTCKFRVNGTIQDTTMAGGSYTPGSKLMLFASHTKGSDLSASIAETAVSNRGSYYLYYFQLCSSTGELKHNLMPATNMTSNAVGLYDTVTSNFYAKATNSGDFIAAEWGSDRAGKKWTGAGDGVSMSDDDNWEGGAAPVAGDDIDFTIAVPNAEIEANIDATFGKVYLGTGDLPAFTGTLKAIAVNDLARMQAYDTATEGFTFTLEAPVGQDLVWNGGAAANWNTTDASWLCNSAASVWYDHNNAIFNTAGATATLTADAEANSLAFNQNATIAGSSTLTAPNVSVAADVSATISAPTAGALTKTGAGTLTLTENRTDAATTLSEGTLALTGTASLDWSKFTFGTDPATPVRLDFGPGATVYGLGASATWNVGDRATITSVLFKAGGNWTNEHFVVGRASGAVTTFINAGGDMMAESYFMIGHDDASASTLVVSGGTVGSTSSSSLQVIVGKTSEGTLVVTNSGVLSAKQSLSVAHNANGTVNVSDGGFVHSGGDIVFHYGNANGRGVINLGRGGVIEAGRAYSYRSGLASFNFDGGTYRQIGNKDFFAANDTGGAIDVTVSENGGMLDNNGFTVGLPRTITGAGGITLIGSGTTTVSADQSYLGTTTVSNGTTLAVSGGVTFAGPVVFAAGSTLDIATPVSDSAAFAATTLNLPAEGTVALTSRGGAFVEGLYAICEMSGVTAADGAKFAPSNGTLAVSWSVDGDMLMLTVGTVDHNTWTGRAGDRNLSNPANWYGLAVPTSGTATINTSGDLIVGTLFSPDVIVFPETCGAVTITGENGITGLSAVTNLSTSTCTFEVPVAFADEICVSQGAYYYYNNSNNQPTLSDGGKVRFAGGVTGSSFAEGTSRRLDGVFTIPASANSANWAASTTAGGLWTVTGGSSLTLTGYPSEQQANDFSCLNNNGAFTTAVIRTSSSPVCLRNEGEFVVTEELEMTLPGADRHIAQRASQGKYKFEKVTLGDNGKAGVFYFANRGDWYTDKNVYVGAGGLCFAEGAQPNTAYAFGRRDKDNVHIYPWRSNYTIGAKGGTTRDVIIIKSTYFHTDDENGVPRTVTLNGIADVRAALTVKGSGRFQVNSDGMNNGATGSITVTDSATLAFASGADLGAGAVTVGVNATMELASGAHTFGGGLTLNDGATLAFNFTERAVTPQIAVAEDKTLTANGTVKVKIAEGSLRPTGGEHVLTTCGGFDAENVTVSLAAGAPEWVRGLSVNADGNIVLDVKPMGTIVIFR